MGIFSKAPQFVEPARPNPKFAIDAGSIPAQIFGLESYSDSIASAARISRREAMQCAAVASGRRLITTLGTLPLALYDVEHNELFNEFLAQPEEHRTRSKTMIDTIDDLLFEGKAFWLVTARSYDKYPLKAKRIHPSEVSLSKGVWRVNGQVVPDIDVIQFESPHDPLLETGARAIRTCLRLEKAAANYSDGTPPAVILSPKNGAEPLTKEEADQLVADYRASRRENPVMYSNGVLDISMPGWSPEQLQLADARQHAVLEISRVMGIDGEDLGVSTTSRTYQNGIGRRQYFLDFTLGPFRAVIEERLSMGDITKRGQKVRFDLDSLLRADALTRMQVAEIGVRIGERTPEEVRDSEHRPALAARPEPTPTPINENQA